MHTQKHNKKQWKNNEEAGFALIILVFFFLALFTSVVFAFSHTLTSNIKNAREYTHSRQAFYTAQSGIEDIIYRLNHQSFADGASVVLSLRETTATTTVNMISANEVEILSYGDSHDARRNVSVKGKVASGVAFGSGVQAGENGVTLSGGAIVDGSIYSNGPVGGSGWRLKVKGDVVSAGPEGSVSHVDADGDVHAHTITDSEVRGDAYGYKMNKVNVRGDAYYHTYPTGVVYGDRYQSASVPDEPLATMPIADSVIDGWENEAEVGGVYHGDFDPSWKTKTIGNIKIEGDLNVSSAGTVIITGPVWVAGSIHVSGGGTIKIDPDLKGKSIPIVADDPSNRSSGSLIRLSGGANLNGSGAEDSYIVLVSRNESVKNGGSQTAINVSGGALGNVVLYAPRGKINLSGGVHVSQMSGYEVNMSGGAQLKYDDGLRSIVFPGSQGAWYVQQWKEVE